jgi:hypothetical protein
LPRADLVGVIHSFGRGSGGLACSLTYRPSLSAFLCFGACFRPNLVAYGATFEGVALGRSVDYGIGIGWLALGHSLYGQGVWEGKIVLEMSSVE